MSEERREAAYAAVHAAGWLTDNAWTNGHIWRSVQAALDAYESATNAECSAPACSYAAGHGGPHEGIPLDANLKGSDQ